MSYVNFVHLIPIRERGLGRSLQGNEPCTPVSLLPAIPDKWHRGLPWGHRPHPHPRPFLPSSGACRGGQGRAQGPTSCLCPLPASLLTCYYFFHLWNSLVLDSQEWVQIRGRSSGVLKEHSGGWETATCSEAAEAQETWVS